jgi:1-pyrroline-5-carboxylate dehydrogenase
MSKGIYNVPVATNEAVKSYEPGSPERKELISTYKEMKNTTIDVPLYIGNEEIFTSETMNMTCPHDHQHILGKASVGSAEHVQAAIDSALQARSQWAAMPWNQRVAIFLKAADLLAGPFRAKINAATMLAQSKNVFQAEIDAAC